MAEGPSVRSGLARRSDPDELRAIKRMWVVGAATRLFRGERIWLGDADVEGSAR